MKISGLQAIFITTLCVLTFTVIAYDIRILNEEVLWIRVWGSSQEYSESWRTVVDITNHPLKEEIMRHLNQSIQARDEEKRLMPGETVYVVNRPEVEHFLGQYSFSSWCLTCMLNGSPLFKDGDTYYLVMVSHSKLPAGFFDLVVAWAVSIATVALWICTVSMYEILTSFFGSLGLVLIAFGFAFLYIGSARQMILASANQMILALAVLSVIIGIILILWGIITKREQKHQSILKTDIQQDE